jgi:hypothetical protein
MHILTFVSGLTDDLDMQKFLTNPELGAAETATVDNDFNIILIDWVFMIVLDEVMQLKIFLERALPNLQRNTIWSV